jgi:hypothetical protein
MTKKVIIISILAVVVVAAAVVGGLVLLKSFKSSTDATVAVTPPSLVADTSKDFGACSIVDKSSIKSVLSTPAADLQGPDNVGRGLVGNGDESQTCVYAFIPGGTIDNGFTINNSFNIEVYVFGSDAIKQSALQLISDDLTEVPSLGERATYAVYIDAADVPDAKIQYSLIVYSGLKRYTFTINEPRDAPLYSSETASAALKTIARSVTY